MPLAELQRLGRFAIEPTSNPGTHVRAHHDPVQLPLAQRREEALEVPGLGWETLWIDMGGEG